MSVHPSLHSGKGAVSLRSVMKRFERVRHLMEKGLWAEDRSIFGLPKIKQTRVKARKAAAKEEKEEAAAAEQPKAETKASE